MKLAPQHCKTLFGAALLLLPPLLLLPAPALAAACPTATLDQILALGVCTIGDARFDFTQPQIGGQTYFNGPFAGDTGLGPAASAIGFTPDDSSGHPGFTIAGNFFALGQALRDDPFRGGLVTGNFYDEVLGYIAVTPGAGKGLSGYSVTLGGAQVNQGNIGSIAKADLNSATAALNDAGFNQLSDSRSFGALVLGTQLFLSNLQTYERSANPSDLAGFASVSYGFGEVPISGAVPEPQSLALLFAGLGLLAVRARRRCDGRVARRWSGVRHWHSMPCGCEFP